MNMHEDSIPLRFTPDGLDEASIDALIDEANAHFSDEPFDRPTDFPARRPMRRRANRRPAPGKAA